MLSFLMSEDVLHFDLSVFEAVSKLWNPVLDAIMKVITLSGEAGIIWILLAFVLFCTRKYRKAGFTMLVALVVMVLCNDFILKNLIARPRPCWEDNEILSKLGWWFESYTFPNIVSQPDSFSFPSGHTSSSFAAAFALLWYNRKYGIPAMVFAFIMGFSRIYVHVHYCTDVIGGAIVGILYALIGILIAKLLYKKLEPLFNKIFDKLFSKRKKVE